MLAVSKGCDVENERWAEEQQPFGPPLHHENSHHRVSRTEEMPEGGWEMKHSI